MNLSIQQLEANLQKNLSAVYFVSGDEPLQKNEALKLVRDTARQQGFTERVVLEADNKFDWGLLQAESQSMSLFGDKRLIELNIPNAKPGAEGSKAIIAFLENCPADVLLLIISGKLEAQQKNSKWVKAIDAKGVVVQVWPVEKAQLPRWLQQRMNMLGIEPTAEAVDLLADRIEGNLLAAEQAVEKLFLLNGAGPVDEDAIRDLVADSSRYNVFQLVDSCLSGDTAQSVKILNGLQGEGVEPVIIVWALAREMRSLVDMSLSMTEQALPQLFRSHRVWQKRQNCVQKALSRHKAGQLQLFLWQLADLDKMNKGLKTGNIWHELVQLVMKIAGQPLMSAKKPKQVAFAHYQ